LKTLSKQQLINQILPVIISLKRVLERMKSPLQRTLMSYLTSLFKNHRTEVETALQFDPIIKSEIEYDIKQFNNRLKKQQLQLQAQMISPSGKCCLPMLFSLLLSLFLCYRCSRNSIVKEEKILVGWRSFFHPCSRAIALY
jgi:hypothetical protein